MFSLFGSKKAKFPILISAMCPQHPRKDWRVKSLKREAEHPVCPACRSNFRPRKWLKPIARYLRLNRFDQRSASLLISDRGIFEFRLSHQAHSSDAVLSDLAEFHVVALVWPLHLVGYTNGKAAQKPSNDKWRDFTSPTLFCPVSVWSQQNYQRWPKTVTNFESS